jgi:hypothetical protein
MPIPRTHSGNLEAWLRRYRNLIIYIMIVGFGDLLQFWFVCAIYMDERNPLVLDEVLIDGSLFFYSATLFCSGIWHLITSPNQSARLSMMFLTVLVVVPSTFFLVLWYGEEARGLIDAQEFLKACVDGAHKISGCMGDLVPQPVIEPHIYMQRQIMIAAVAAALAIALVVWSECGHRPEDEKEPLKIVEPI